MSDYSMQVEKLNEMYNAFNAQYFENKLESVTITIQENKEAYGHFTISKVWKNANGFYEHEINISATHLNRSKYELCGTLLHEMCHLFAMENGIQDTSRQGRYHNREFKRIAEQRALKIDIADGIGWSVTTATDELKSFIDTTNIDFVNVYRVYAEKIKKSTKEKPTIYKYVCPCCGLEVKTTKENANILCQDCDKMLTIEIK